MPTAGVTVAFKFGISEMLGKLHITPSATLGFIA